MNAISATERKQQKAVTAACVGDSGPDTYDKACCMVLLTALASTYSPFLALRFILLPSPFLNFFTVVGYCLFPILGVYAILDDIIPNSDHVV